ncbi:alpha/beta hydrolase [Flavobacterium psychrotrophum]|uniref:alpha/beta hydrolase n=1 Tax=Flavobacterium psychrotrophum TaxID=2294119 RepID=UPI000E316AC4|nr:alpha/beta hydrolase [Flavobacterium psychrotrophum]
MRTKLTALMGIFIFIATNAFAQKELYHLKYGAAKQQQLDLFLPKDINKKTPVVIMLHGGAWSMGGNEYTDKHARDLRDRGFVVANVDYRYVSDSVHLLQLLDDIDSAVQYVQDNAKKYGYTLKGLNLVGISAGAHLSLMYGYVSKRKVSSITAMCAPSIFDAETFLPGLYKQGRIKILEDLANAGYNPAEGADVSAFENVSPYFHISKVPTQLIHGDNDELVDYHLSVRFEEKLKQINVPSNLIIRPGKGHDVGMNSPDTEKMNIDAMEAWVKKWE